MSADSRPPLTTTTSIWPAAVVGLVAIGMLVVFTLINVLFDQGVRTTSSTTVIVVDALAPASRSPVATLCEVSGTVPSNIASGLFVPRQTTMTHTAAIVNQGAGDFDCQATLRTRRASGADILTFYNARLANRGWHLFSQGGAVQGHEESLFQKAGSDGFYWILGVTTESTVHGVAQWRLRLYQNSSTI